MNIARFISIGGILTTLAVLFQSAPVFLPTVGMALSPFSTLPIAIAAYFSSSLGILVLLSSAFILLFISIEETLILLFTTGLLGLIVGFFYKRKLVTSILCSAIALAIGMATLTFIIGISAFGDFTSSLSLAVTLLIFILFSLIYASIWNISIKKFIKFLIKIKV